MVDIHFELGGDYLPGSRGVILGIAPGAGVNSPVRQSRGDTQLLSYKSPILIQSFKSPNEIGEYPPIGIDKPVELVPVRRRVNASAAAVLDPIHEFVESHFLF